jgi:glutathione synthase/RimK-type ligase-like ATP-grasp enzyme
VRLLTPYRRLIRVIVIDFKALPEATVYDEPLPGSWKCSVCLNPRIKKLDNPPQELLTLAEKTARAFDARVNFIDFFETASGGPPQRTNPIPRFILNEINTACNLTRHEIVTGVPIHKKIAEFLLQNPPRIPLHLKMNLIV